MKVKKHTLEFPVKFSWPFPQDATASAWVLTVECIQLCVLLTFLTQNSILIWPKLPVSGSSSMIIYTETIQSDPSAVAYISMLLMCSSLKDEHFLSTQFPASHTSLYSSIAFVLLAIDYCRTFMKMLQSTNQLRVGKACLSLLAILHPVLSACLPQSNRSQRFDLLVKNSCERSVMQL